MFFKHKITQHRAPPTPPTSQQTKSNTASDADDDDDDDDEELASHESGQHSGTKHSQQSSNVLQSDRFLQALGVPGMKQSSDVAPVFVCVSRRWNFVIPSSSSMVFNLKRRCSYSLKVVVGVESIVAAAKPPKSAVIATTTARTSSLILHMAAASNKERS